MLPAPGDAAPPRHAAHRRHDAARLGARSSRSRGLGLSDSLVWPLALVAAGVVLLSGTTFGARGEARAARGLVLIVVGVVIFVGNNTRGTASTLLAPGAVAVALLLVLAPWAWRLAREREAERAARIRTEERADFAARVHDSVLQTLTLIQKEPADARRLARRQERELRAWLYPDREPAAKGRSPTRSSRRRRRSRSCTACASTSCAPATRRSTSARRRSCSRRARRWRTRRGIRASTRSPSSSTRRRRRSRSTCATAAAGSTRTRSPPTGAASRSRFAAGWSAWAAARRIVSAPGEGTEVELRAPVSRPLAPRRARRRPRSLSRGRARAGSSRRSRSSARRAPSPRPCR